MSLLKRIAQVKNKNKNLEKIMSATISTEIVSESESATITWGMYLDANSSFRMIYIEYVGSVIITKTPDMKFSIDNNNKTITITNLNKTTLQDNLLFEYRGSVSKIRKAIVYGWGQRQFFAKIITPSETSFNINNNENIVSTSDIKLPGGDERGEINGI